NEIDASRGTSRLHQKRREEHQQRTRQMHRRKNPLPREKTVGHHTDKKRRNHRRDWPYRIHPREILRPKSDRAQITRPCDIPSSPYCELEEHHERQFQTKGSVHGEDSVKVPPPDVKSRERTSSAN